ncbi:Ig-like domain-containing protein [Kribbella sp. NPDC002412]
MESQQNRRPLGRQIKDTHCFSGKSLFFAVLSSVVCSAIVPALGAGRTATVLGAALSPLVVAVISTQGPGLARSIGIASLSAIALLITISGFTIPEAIAGNGSLTATGSGTFVTTKRGPTPTPPQTQAAPPTRKPTTITQPTQQPTQQPTSKPAPTTPPASPTGLLVDLPVNRQCPEVPAGEAKTCKQIGVRNTGSANVEIATVSLDGDQASAFTLTKVCNGTLKPGTACSIRLRFEPMGVGAHEAVLVVRLNPGNVERRVTITGNATGSETGACLTGYLFRRATPDDTVCVTPDERALTQQQNSAHIRGHLATTDGTCVDGYVWREAVSGDHICVTPEERTAAQRLNELHSERVAH